MAFIYCKYISNIYCLTQKAQGNQFNKLQGYQITQLTADKKVVQQKSFGSERQENEEYF